MALHHEVHGGLLKIQRHHLPSGGKGCGYPVQVFLRQVPVPSSPLHINITQLHLCRKSRSRTENILYRISLHLCVKDLGPVARRQYKHLVCPVRQHDGILAGARGLIITGAVPLVLKEEECGYAFRPVGDGSGKSSALIACKRDMDILVLRHIPNRIHAPRRSLPGILDALLPVHKDGGYLIAGLADQGDIVASPFLHRQHIRLHLASRIVRRDRDGTEPFLIQICPQHLLRQFPAGIVLKDRVRSQSHKGRQHLLVHGGNHLGGDIVIIDKIEEILSVFQNRQLDRAVRVGVRSVEFR